MSERLAIGKKEMKSEGSNKTGCDPVLRSVSVL